MAVVRNTIVVGEATESTDDSRKTPKRIIDKLDLLDHKLDGIYTDIYTSRPSELKMLDNTIDQLDHVLDQLQDDNDDVLGITKLMQRVDSANHITVNKMMGSVKDLFSDGSVVNQVFANDELRKYIVAQNKQYDTLCRYIPRLMDAIELKRDTVLCSDNFSKNFVNPKSNKSNKEDAEIFARNSKRLEEEYEFSEFLDKTYINCSKYGEDFIYIVPYKEAFERIARRRLNRSFAARLGSYSFYENSGYDGGSREILSEGFTESKEYKDYSTHMVNAYNLDMSDFDKSIPVGSLNLHFNTSGVLMETVNEQAVFHNKKALDEFKSLSEAYIDKDTIDYADAIKANDGITGAATTLKDGLFIDGNLKIDPDKIDDDFFGAVVERLPRENVIPVYIGKKCLGYYYLEIADDHSACGFCGKHHGTVPGITGQVQYGYDMAEDQYEMALRYICDVMSRAIDTKFINSNKDIKEEIYAILRYNEKFDITRSNDVGVTFIPADDIVHCYFELDEDTHRGISDLQRAIVPGMLYILLYLTDIIGKITRSTDKRIYYVKQNIETNVARTMMNVIQQIKKGNMGMRQIESMNSIFNIVGQYNDFVIPLSQSGDAPIQFEVMQGQDIQTPTEMMEKMEEAAINTIMPIELVNSSMQQDFATRFSMSNTRFLKTIYTRQKKTQAFGSKMYTKIYNYEFMENNRLIEIILPPPVYLVMTNNQQLIDNVSQMADKIIDIEYQNEPDEVKAEFKKIFVRDYLSTYFDYPRLEQIIQLSKVNIEIAKNPATEDGEEDMGQYM
jgi:hypothetical protein